MKKLFSSILFFAAITSFAQNPVINILNDDGERISGTYYKDIDSLLNPYEGTWLYENGNTSLKIILKKILSDNNYFLEDMIIGEYQYIENGIEKVNTLSEIDIVYPNQIKHHLKGNTLIKKTSRPVCTDCATNEKRLRLGITEPDSFGTVLIRIIEVNGQQAIKIMIRKKGPNVYVEGQPPLADDFLVKSGEYILIKQP